MNFPKPICILILLMVSGMSTQALAADSKECLTAGKAAFDLAFPKGYDYSALGIACSEGSTAAELKSCIPAAFTALKGSLPATGVVKVDAVARACSGGTTADQLNACIPAAKNAFDNVFSAQYDPNVLGTVCSRGNTSAQAILCISSESAAYDFVLQGKSGKSPSALAELCAGDSLRQAAYDAQRELGQVVHVLNGVDDDLYNYFQTGIHGSVKSQKKQIETILKKVREAENSVK
jgi:hypothetical protein